MDVPSSGVSDSSVLIDLEFLCVSQTTPPKSHPNATPAFEAKANRGGAVGASEGLEFCKRT